MKEVTFMVTLKFSGKISDDGQLKAIAENIADSLKHTADTVGIVPDDCEQFTESIEVYSDVLGIDVKLNLV